MNTNQAPSVTHAPDNPQRGALSVAVGSARMTLLRGTPAEIELDLAAIDRRIAELEAHAQAVRHSRDYWADRAHAAEAQVAQLEKNCTQIYDAMKKAEAEAKFFQTLVQSHRSVSSPNAEPIHGEKDA